MRVGEARYTSPYYDSANFTLANGTTYWDFKEQVPNILGTDRSSLGSVCFYLRIVTDQTLQLWINGTAKTGSRIILPAAETPFVLDEIVEISNLYFANDSGSSATVKLILGKGIAKS